MTQQQRASQRLAQFAAMHQSAATLARYASLATRIDAPLLRRLRLSLMPGSDASAEADLWFGDLSESRGSDGFVLDGAVASLLQRELCEERLHDGRRALDAAYDEMERVHAQWPASLQLEEKLTYRALAGGDGAQQAISDLLRPAMVAMASGGQRSVEVSRWVLRAVPRLPRVARENDAAIAMVLTAMAALGASPVSLEIGKDRPLPPDLGWLLPPSALSALTSLSCEVQPRALVFRQPRAGDPAGSQFQLPLTRPLVLELSWSVADTASVRIQMVEIDVALELPEGWRDLHVRTLGGVSYRLDRAAADPQAGNTRDLLRACVEVRSGDAGAFGVIVAPGMVLMPRHAVTESSGSVPWFEVRQGERSTKAEVVASDSRVELALLSLEIPIEDSLVMPHRDKAPGPGEPVLVLAHGEGGPLRDGVGYRGRIQLTAVTTTVAERRYDGLLQLVLDDDSQAAPEAGLSGAPVVVDGAMVGLVTMRGNTELYASSAPVIARFLRWALRPGAHQPDILLSYAPQDDYGKGKELDEHSLERVAQALRTAHLRGWDTSDTTFDEKELVRLGDLIEGAVCLLTPVASGVGRLAQRQLAAVAFRRWTDPTFAVALVTYQTSGPRLPRPLQNLAQLSLDSLDDEALWQRLQDVLDSDAVSRSEPPPQEPAFLTYAFERLLSIAPKGSSFDQSERDAFTTDLRAASTRLPPWLSSLPEDEARAIVDLAAMLALPGGETLAVLRRAAQAQPGGRAVHIGAMAVQYARLLLAKAWFPRTAPPQLVIRDQQWPSDASPDRIVDQVVQQVNSQLECIEEDTRWLLANLSACYVVIVATRPLPGERVLSGLRRALPGALLCFLGADRPQAGDAGKLDIATVPAPQSIDTTEWIANYKQLMDVVAPKASRQDSHDQPGAEPPAGGGVFISYAREDSITVQRLADGLHAAGFDVWIDERGLKAGDDWTQKIEQAIQSSAVFLPVVSRAALGKEDGALAREWRIAEARQMASNERFIVPVVLDDERFDSESLPESFRGLQFARLPRGDVTPEFADELGKIVEDFRSHRTQSSIHPSP